MRIRFLEIARHQPDEAIEHYGDEVPGLGDAFLAEVIHSLKRIGEFPDAWHPFSLRTRRCRTKRFPYGIIYQMRVDEILVIAVAHLHRAPDYWKGRI